MSRINYAISLIEISRRQGRLHSQTLESDPSITMNLGYDSNGQLQFRFSFQRGRLHGPGRTWYKNGQLRQEDPFHKGTLHGWAREWYENGQLKSEVYYRTGQYEGRRREWYPNGRPKSECFYKENKIQGLSFEWHANGQIKETVRYLEGLRQGIWKEFDKQGRLLSQRLYVRGVHYTGKLQHLLDTKRLTARHIINLNNTALRRICLEELGYERFLAQVDYTVIDREGDNELVRIHWHRDEEPISLVKVKCPSTGAFYTLRVPPHVQRVHEAVAWTFSLPEDQYHPQEES